MRVGVTFAASIVLAIIWWWKATSMTFYTMINWFTCKWNNNKTKNQKNKNIMRAWFQWGERIPKHLNSDGENTVLSVIERYMNEWIGIRWKVLRLLLDKKILAMLFATISPTMTEIASTYNCIELDDKSKVKIYISGKKKK